MNELRQAAPAHNGPLTGLPLVEISAPDLVLSSHWLPADESVSGWQAEKMSSVMTRSALSVKSLTDIIIKIQESIQYNKGKRRVRKLFYV